MTQSDRKSKKFSSFFGFATNAAKDVEKCAIEKLGYAIEHYERFRTNFVQKKRLLENDTMFEWGIEKGLLIAKLDEKEFDRFLRGFTKYLKDLVTKGVELKCFVG